MLSIIISISITLLKDYSKAYYFVPKRKFSEASFHKPGLLATMTHKLILQL